jgi:hypothetical protein
MLAIHGDKQQNERDWVLDQFKTGKSPIMVATDVASRGIGMYHHPPSPMATSSDSTCCTLLSCLGALLTVRICLIIIVSNWFSTNGVLIRCVAFTLLYSRVFTLVPFSLPWYECGVGILLPLIKLLAKVLLFPGPSDPHTPGWHFDALSIAPSPLGVKYRWLANMLSHSPSSSVLERCYTNPCFAC